MSEITLESLELKKPLDKMTAKELRELVIEKLPMIVGASGMVKEVLLSEIKQVLGIAEEPKPVENENKTMARALKAKVKELKVTKAAATSRKDREILRKKIGRLKKKSRRYADLAKTAAK